MIVLKVIGTIGRFALAGALIIGHFVMSIIGALICAITSQANTEVFMEKKETTPCRAARRNYEERNKDKRKQTSGNFGTMIPRDLFDEINAFLKERNMTKVDFIRTAYEIMKSENNGTHN